jgi:hypothetical protein
MSFSTYIIKEKKILRNIYLVDKFFEGKSLKERTNLDNYIIDNIASFCNGDKFRSEILSNHHCSIGSYSNKNLNCPYLSNFEDINNLRACTYYI